MSQNKPKWRESEMPLNGRQLLFFNKTGYVATFTLENCGTVNSDQYTTICFPEVIDELHKNNYKRRIILHHDNASSYTAKQTNKLLKEKNVKLLSNPVYSPGLVSWDFFSQEKLRTNYGANDFHHQKRLSKSMKNMFPRSPGRSGINVFKIGLFI
ncbi:hypothetical protein EVAR_5489_1 [Eumeta japonica]|uniref:Mariner Mos1 transposase n=1 Tax=Eumeta variegata TaxID=151549 RepID=A0A4C1TBX5_EUMVA|nr:hypothetical protein EVAR_5489_1 [Eumeta japonica]